MIINNYHGNCVLRGTRSSDFGVLESVNAECARKIKIVLYIYNYYGQEINQKTNLLYGNIGLQIIRTKILHVVFNLVIIIIQRMILNNSM